MWDRFSYVCRKAHVTSGEWNTAAARIARINKESESSFYGDQLQADSLPKKLLEKVGQLPNEDDAKHVLSVYGDLDISRYLILPARLQRVTVYLFFVTLVFFLMSTIYAVKVVPSFVGVFESLDVSVPADLVLFERYGVFYTLFVVLLLSLNSIVGITFKKIYSFQSGYENGLVFKFFSFSGIRQSYLRLIKILSFPIQFQLAEKNSNDSKISRHLIDAKKSGLCITTEMQALVKIETQTLSRLCERQMQIMSTIVSLLIVLAVFFFLSSAYLPLFSAGETL